MKFAVVMIFELPEAGKELEKMLSRWEAAESVRPTLEGARYVVMAVDESDVKLWRPETERDVITECANLRAAVNQAGVGCKFKAFVSPGFRMRLTDALGVLPDVEGRLQ